MKINKELLEQFKKSESKLLAVTKYLEKDDTIKIINELEENYSDIIYWYWENRVESLKEKELDREKAHFIWNIQTKQIKTIIKYCSTIHSIDSIKHLRKIEEICEKSWNWVKIFLQINIDSTKEWWITPEQIPEFLNEIAESENISLVWFSAIWKAEFTREEKEAEFQLLKELKNKYIQNWLISAWTSKDYEIAIEKEISVIRIWTKLYN